MEVERVMSLMQCSLCLGSVQSRLALLLDVDLLFYLMVTTTVGENNACIPPTLEGWVYIIPIHGPLDGPLYTWAQYTSTIIT